MQRPRNVLHTCTSWSAYARNHVIPAQKNILGQRGGRGGMLEHASQICVRQGQVLHGGQVKNQFLVFRRKRSSHCRPLSLSCWEDAGLIRTLQLCLSFRFCGTVVVKRRLLPGLRVHKHPPLTHWVASLTGREQGAPSILVAYLGLVLPEPPCLYCHPNASQRRQMVFEKSQFYCL